MSERVRIEENDHLLGRRDAEVVLVEYADFQCPYCRRAHVALTALRAEHGERLALAYRHLPLSHLHPDAQAAAEAAEAAGETGKFWEMHDALFAHQDRLDAEALPSMAAALGMDGERVRADLEGGRFRARVQEMAEGGRALGASGTPTLFINGERYQGDSDHASLAAAIGKALDGG